MVEASLEDEVSFKIKIALLGDFRKQGVDLGHSTETKIPSP